jgi:hypothetical protein
MLCGQGRVRNQDGYQVERYDHCATRQVTANSSLFSFFWTLARITLFVNYTHLSPPRPYSRAPLMCNGTTQQKEVRMKVSRMCTSRYLLTQPELYATDTANVKHETLNQSAFKLLIDTDVISLNANMRRNCQYRDTSMELCSYLQYSRWSGILKRYQEFKGLET